MRKPDQFGRAFPCPGTAVVCMGNDAKRGAHAFYGYQDDIAVYLRARAAYFAQIVAAAAISAVNERLGFGFGRGRVEPVVVELVGEERVVASMEPVGLQLVDVYVGAVLEMRVKARQPHGRRQHDEVNRAGNRLPAPAAQQSRVCDVFAEGIPHDDEYHGDYFKCHRQDRIRFPDVSELRRGISETVDKEQNNTFND